MSNSRDDRDAGVDAQTANGDPESVAPFVNVEDGSESVIAARRHAARGSSAGSFLFEPPLPLTEAAAASQTLNPSPVRVSVTLPNPTVAVSQPERGVLLDADGMPFTLGVSRLAGDVGDIELRATGLVAPPLVSLRPGEVPPPAEWRRRLEDAVALVAASSEIEIQLRAAIQVRGVVAGLEDLSGDQARIANTLGDNLEWLIELLESRDTRDSTKAAVIDNLASDVDRWIKWAATNEYVAFASYLMNVAQFVLALRAA